MKKGDAVTVMENGESLGDGLYYIEEFEDKNEEYIIVGGFNFGTAMFEKSQVQSKSVNYQQKTLNVLVDLARGIEGLNRKIDELIPKCPTCGENMICYGPEGACEECEEEDLGETDKKEIKPN